MYKGSKDKAAKDKKKCFTKKVKLKSDRNCLKASQLENKIKIQKKIKLTQLVATKTMKSS